MSKVVFLDERRKEKQFKSYLTSLKTDELQREAGLIMEMIKDNSFSDDYYIKGAFLLDELARRVDEKEMSSIIKNFSDGLRCKLRKRNIRMLS